MLKHEEDCRILIQLLSQTKRQILSKLRKNKSINLLSFLQAETLEFIETQTQPTMKEISNFLCITPPSATSIINNLVKLRMLERVSDPHDRRIIRLKITSQGKIFIEKHGQIIENQMQSVLQKLSSEEHSQLINIYKKINNFYN
mgnify:CR=1 FL=1